jgi:diguanylate cyclase
MSQSLARPLLPSPKEQTPALMLIMGQGAVLQAQVAGVLFSFMTYVAYGAITAAQAYMGVMSSAAAHVLVALGIGGNLICYAVVRSGWVLEGFDPGLSRTQLVFGVLLMYAAYAAVGPASPGLLVVMASHVVYCMFIMKPRQVWVMVSLTMAGLIATIGLCVWLWPERYVWQVQLSGLMYALLVMPLISLLAYRVTDMTKRLVAQHADLEAAMTKLRELATRDELTRAHNRRHMTELMDIQQAHHRRLNAPLSLAVLDLDRFKSVNDQFGHAVGDQVLKAFADLSREQLRAADMLGRWGGEEFLILMPNTTAEQGVVAMERLQAHLTQAGPAAMPLGLAISFSAGVTELSGSEEPQQALERADQAMYRAKTSGRARSIRA